jgi:epoxyqueuosine reductase QueG
VAMTERAFDDAFGETALERAGRAGLARNAAIVLENTRVRGGAACPAA